MIDTRVLPPPAKDFDTAKRRYVEFYGSVAVMNTYLKIAVFCLCLATVGLTILQIKTIQLFRNVRPVVIRINELGRAEAVSFGSLDYKPQPRGDEVLPHPFHPATLWANSRHRARGLRAIALLPGWALSGCADRR